MTAIFRSSRGGVLFLGNREDANKHISRLRIKNVCRVAAGDDFIQYVGVLYLIIPAYDSPDYLLSPVFEQCFKFINNALDRGENVLVHCHAGISRSATIVTAYLLSRAAKKTTVNDVLDYVVGRRAIVNPNQGFRQQLEKFNSSRQRPADKLARA